MKQFLLLLILLSLSFAESRKDPSLVLTNPEDSLLLSQFYSVVTQCSSISADFIQQKEMKALNTPLRSSGTFRFVQDSLILWNQHEPYEEKTAVMADGTIHITNEDGEMTTEKSGAAENRMNAVMSDIYSGDFSKIDRLFSLFLNNVNNQWNLTLIPRRKSMKRGFTSLSLICDNTGFISEVIMESPNGTTTLTFSKR